MKVRFVKTFLGKMNNEREIRQSIYFYSGHRFIKLALLNFAVDFRSD